MDIRKYLENNRIITDGAMGTWYERLTGYGGRLAERANLWDGERIQEIHRSYIEAGARLIRTNSFAINSMFFDREEIPAVLAAAWENARKAVLRSGYAIGGVGEEPAKSIFGGSGEEPAAHSPFDGGGENDSSLEEKPSVWIGADMGPIHENESRDAEAIKAEYKELARQFLSMGARVFVFETLSEFRYIREVLAYIKEQQPKAFTIVQFSFNQNGYTRAGMSVGALLTEAAGLDTVDAVGFNCGVGPLHLYELLKDVVFPKGKYVTALPNAGYPTELRGRMLYSENVPYYVEKMTELAGLGIDLLGGCCGTTPEHILGISTCLKDGQRPKKKEAETKDGGDSLYPAETGVSVDERTPLLQKLEEGTKVYVVELDPPFNADDHKLMEGAALLRDVGVDMITVADSPMARARADAIASAIKLQYTQNVAVMPHIGCRDRNMIAQRAQFIGMHMNGLRHALVVTGDPVLRGDRERIKSVFDFNSIKLMRYIQTMNREVFGSRPIYYGGALNYNHGSIDNIAARMKQKMKAGCSWFMTQPVYSGEDIERLKILKDKTGGKILAGIMPLVSRKNALFIRNEMPGIHVPDSVLSNYKEGMSREEYEAVAVSISVELMAQLADICDGYYLMTPFNRSSLIKKIILEARAAASEKRL